MSRVFRAPRDRVWKAWSELDQLRQWWGPKGCPLEVENTVTFTEQAGATTVSLRAVPFGELMEERKYFEDLRPSLDQGYGGTFDQLGDYLAKA